MPCVADLLKVLGNPRRRVKTIPRTDLRSARRMMDSSYYDYISKKTKDFQEHVRLLEFQGPPPPVYCGALSCQTEISGLWIPINYHKYTLFCILVPV